MSDPHKDDTSHEEVDIDFEPEEELGTVASLKAKLAKVKEDLEVVKKERSEYLDGWQRCKADYAAMHLACQGSPA